MKKKCFLPIFPTNDFFKKLHHASFDFDIINRPIDIILNFNARPASRFASDFKIGSCKELEGYFYSYELIQSALVKSQK